MGAFEYTALDQRGKERKGVLEGDTPRQIRQQLREKGMSPLSVVEVQQREARQSARRFLFQRGISAADLSLLTRQFATLVHSGLPIDEALRAVSQQTEKARIRSMVLGVRSKVLEGHTLADAFADFPHVFSDMFRSTVAAGEHSGHLGPVLERLADYTENRQELVSKIRVALIYPIFLVVASIAIVSFLLAYVVPQVVGVFDNTGQALPGITVALITLSEWIREYGLAALMVLIFVGAVVRWALKKPVPKREFHRVLLKLPLLARLVRGLNTARFSRTFSILAASGVPILDALRISADVVSNLPMKQAIENAAVMVREGASIHVALDKSGYIPPMTIHLIASGESSGNLEGMLEKAANNQERETETLISSMMGLLGPVVLLIMAGGVLMIVLAILMPIFEMNQMI
jgi:general secretion pathway protein F